MAHSINLSESTIVTLADQDTCTICIDRFDEKTDKKCYRLACGHIFHQACLDEWNKNKQTCPVCRKNFKIIIQPRGSYGGYIKGPIKNGIVLGCVIGIISNVGLILHSLTSMHTGRSPRDVDEDINRILCASPLILSSIGAGVGFIKGHWKYLSESGEDVAVLFEFQVKNFS